MRRALALLLIFAFPGLAAAGLRVAAKPEYAPGELLVFFNPGAGLGAPPSGNPKFADAREELHASTGSQLLERLDRMDLHRVRLAAGADEAAVTALYLQSPLVLKVTRNAIARALGCGSSVDFSPNDSFCNSSFQPWFQAIRADQAYSDWKAGCITLSSQVIVAVTDTGLFQHSELDGMTVTGASFVPGAPTTNDDEGHGTLVSGIIASAADNSAGFTGAFFDSSLVRIMPVKVLNAEGEGTDSDIAQGVLYAADHGAKVINMSLGGPTDFPAIESAINLAYSQGVLVVAAAGNHDPHDAAQSPITGYPASYASVVSVAALDHSYVATSFYSNVGKVDIAAPGGDASFFSSGCVGSPSGENTEIWGLCNTAAGYNFGAGTSFASPMVSAAAALLLAQDSSRSNGDLRRILMQSATALAAPASSVGAGRLDVDKALGYGKGPSTAPGVKLKIYNWPNPFNPNIQPTNFTFSLPSRMDVDLRIVDMAGDLVYSRHYGANETNAGDRANQKTWDGKNGVGAMVANGVYIVSISAGGQVAKNRVAVLK